MMLQNQFGNARNILKSDEQLGAVVHQAQIDNFLKPTDADQPLILPQESLDNLPNTLMQWQDLHKVMSNLTAGNGSSPCGFNIDIFKYAWTEDETVTGIHNSQVNPIRPVTPLQMAFLNFAQASSMNQLPVECYDTFLHVAKCTPVLKSNDDGSLRRLPAPHQDKAKLRLAGAGNKMKLIFERAQTLANKNSRRDKLKTEAQYGTSQSGAEIACGTTSLFHEQLESDWADRQTRNQLQQRNPDHHPAPTISQNMNDICSQLQNAFPDILGTDQPFQELKDLLNASHQACQTGPDQSGNMAALVNLLSSLPEFLQLRALHVDDLNALGVLNLDIENAHTSYRLKEAFEAACLAEPSLSRLFYQATAMKSTLIIPDGRGGFIKRILKKGGIQGVLSTGILFKHLVGPVLTSLKEIILFENIGIEDDIVLKGTLFQRIITFYALKKVLFAKTGLILQQAKCKNYSMHPDDCDLFTTFCNSVHQFGHAPIVVPPNQGYKFCGKYFGNRDWTYRNIERQVDKCISNLQELEALSTIQTQFKLLQVCDTANLSHLLRLYPPSFLDPLYNRWDTALMDWAITKLDLPRRNRQLWRPFLRRVFSPIRFAGLGLRCLKRGAHAGFICSWAAVIEDGIECNPSIHDRIQSLKEAANTSRQAFAANSPLSSKLLNSIRQIHLGRSTEEEEEGFPPTPNLTQRQLTRLPDVNGRNFWAACANKGSQRKIREVDNQRRFDAELNAPSTSISHKRYLTQNSNKQGKAGASLRTKGVGISQMSDAAFQLKAAGHLGVPLQTIYRLLTPADVDRSGQIFTKSCRDEENRVIPCPLCNQNQLDNHGHHLSKCLRINRSLTHDLLCLQTKRLIQTTLAIPTPVTLEEANLMIPGSPPSDQNHRADVNALINGIMYVTDISMVSNALQPGQDEIQDMTTSIQARDQTKRNKYRNLRPEYTFVPLIFGVNGFIGKSAASFFKVLANAVDSLGRIPLWYYWQNIVPEFLTAIDIGNCLTHQNFFRTLNRRDNPQRRRIIDSNARVGYPSSAPRRFF
jgi:hypothetical protein